MQMQQQECCCEFLSTPSARRATSCAGHQIAETRISIHALREEGDAMCVAFSSAKAYFYPRPPRGGRPDHSKPASSEAQFLSTPSARRATACWAAARVPALISIHALREEGDPALTLGSPKAFYFYPRPPRGGRQKSIKIFRWATRFLSTPSARRATTPGAAF